MSSKAINPYKPNSTNTLSPIRPVRKHIAVGVILLLAALLAAIPAILLLLVKWSTAGVHMGILDPEINGKAIPTDAIIGWSIGVSIFIASGGLISLAIARQNLRRNRSDVLKSLASECDSECSEIVNRKEIEHL